MEASQYVNSHDGRHHHPSPCQFVISVTGIVVGALLTLTGIFGFCALKNCLPPKPLSLYKFSIIGLKNSYFVMGAGCALTLLSIAALMHLFQKAGEMERVHKQ